jgi:hypothetical protein
MPAPASRRRDTGAPLRPLPALLPQVCLALLVVAAGFAAGIEWPWVLTIACSLVFVAMLQATRAAVELARRRRAADEWLLWGAAARPSSALLSWRADELRSRRLRSTLSHSLRRIEREVRGGTLPGSAPLNQRAIRRHIGLLHALQERLDDRTRPVSARGMLLVDRLLTEPGSPLYSAVSGHVLAKALAEALAAIDPAAAAA